MASYPPPPPMPPYGFDARTQRRLMRDQQRNQDRAAKMAAQQYRYQMRAMKRSSVLGPLLLVTVGVVFLMIQTGKLLQGTFWSWYSRWWPVLLVAGGLVLLAEWAFDQYRQRDPSQPPYRRSIGGGVTLLLIFFAITGLVIGQARLHVGNANPFYGWNFNDDSMEEFLGNKHESDQPLDLAVPVGAAISVDNPHGDVTITGTSADNQIHLAIHKEVYSSSDSDALKKAQQLTPRVDSNSSRVAVTVPSIDGAHADLVITVPADAALTVSANHGDVHVNGIRNSVAATANHGDIELSSIGGQVTTHVNHSGSSVSAHSVTGAVSIEGHASDVTVSDVAGPVSIRGEFFGSTHIEHITGAVHFHTSRTDFQLGRLDGVIEISSDSNLSADQAVGPVVLTTRDRNITLDRISGDLSVTNRNGTVDLTGAPPLGNVTITDRNGTVKLAVPEKAGFTLQADTTNGNIDTDFSLATNGGSNRSNVSGTIGAGGPVVHISTTNGDVSVRKTNTAPLPTVPPMPPNLAVGPMEGHQKLIFVPDAAAPKQSAKPSVPAKPIAPTPPEAPHPSN